MSVRELKDFKRTMYRSKHQRSITDKDVLMAQGFADADLARCVNTRRSHTLFLFHLGACLICWQSKQQTSAVLSSMESENISACACTLEGIWLKRILEELGCIFSGPVTIFEDNQACIYYFKNPGDHQRTNILIQSITFFENK